LGRHGRPVGERWPLRHFAERGPFPGLVGIEGWGQAREGIEICPAKVVGSLRFSAYYPVSRIP